MTDLATLQERVREAEDALDAAKAEAEAARQAEYKARQQRALDELMAMPDEAFISPSPSWSAPERPYVLPFGKGYARFNPLDDADRENHEFGPTWTAGMTAIICKKDERENPTRLIWTSGYVRRGFDNIGERFVARHDQTGAKLGEYEIVGLAFYGPDGKLARTIGDVPNRKFAQSTYK